MSFGTGAPCLGRRCLQWRLRCRCVAATWLTLFGGWLWSGIRARTPISPGLCQPLWGDGCGVCFWGTGGVFRGYGRGLVGIGFNRCGFGWSFVRRTSGELACRRCGPDGEGENRGQQAGGRRRFSKSCQGCGPGRIRGGCGNERVAGGNPARCCRLSHGILGFHGNQPGGECGKCQAPLPQSLA